MKKTILLGTIAAVSPIGVVVACGNKSNDNNESISINNHFWEKELKVFQEPMTHIWDADKSTTIADIMTQMNEAVHFNFVKKMEKISPFEFGQYLVNMYNDNSGGNMYFKIKFNGEAEIVSINFSSILKELIVSLDKTSQPILKTTKKSTFINIIDAGIHTAKKTGSNINHLNAMTWLLNLFGKLGNDVFGVTSPIGMVTDPTSVTSIRALKIINLIDALPGPTIKQFPSMSRLFGTLAKEFTDSIVAKKWAAHNGISDQFKELKHYMIKTIMFSGV